MGFFNGAYCLALKFSNISMKTAGKILGNQIHIFVNVCVKFGRNWCNRNSVDPHSLCVTSGVKNIFFL